VEEREWYREEGINDREQLLAGWVVGAWTILVRIHMIVYNQVIALIPYESVKAARGVAAMSCDWRITECLKYW